MRVVLFGATGMVGKGVLLECLSDAQVTSVLVIGRNACGIDHLKLREVIRRDFLDYSPVEEDLVGHNACFFCLGVSSAGMRDAEYHRLTYDITVRAAETLVRLNPEMTFCYVSGTGTDSSEQGRSMWARVKGKTENRLLQLPFKAAYMFRPGYIQPMKGVTSKTRLYRAIYAVLAPVYPVLNAIAPRYVTTTEKVGLAMIRVARDGYEKPHLENHDINRLARRP